MSAAALTVTVVQPGRDLRFRAVSDDEPGERVVGVDRGGVDGEHAANRIDLVSSEAGTLRPMGKVKASASVQLEAAPDRVLSFLRDYRDNRPRILTDNYTAYRVEQGGKGDGTVYAYHFAAGGRERDYRLHVQRAGVAAGGGRPDVVVSIGLVG